MYLKYLYYVKIGVPWKFFRMLKCSAAAFAAGEKRAEGGYDGGEDAETFVDGNAVGNKTADVLRPVGGLGQGRIELTRRIHDATAGSLQFTACCLLSLLQGL